MHRCRKHGWSGGRRTLFREGGRGSGADGVARIDVHVIGAVTLVLVSVVVRLHRVQLPPQVALATWRRLRARSALGPAQYKGLAFSTQPISAAAIVLPDEFTQWP